MNKDLTEIGIVLDKSGSMGGIRKDTIGGFNTFIEDQKKEPGQANVSLINFSDELKKIYRCENIQKVATLTTKNYVPGGLTALYDGIGTMIDTLKGDIDKRNDIDKPGKVIVVIITDGYENCSKEYDAAKIKKQIKDLEDNHSWAFLYLGANQDAFSTGANLGMSRVHTANWVGTKSGSAKLYKSVSDTMSNYRATGVANLADNLKDDDDKDK